MAKWKIVAFPDEENYGMGKKEKIIVATSYEDAMAQAWREFPEYHEVGAYKIAEEA